MTCSCRLNHANSLDVYRPCHGLRLDFYLRFRCTNFGMEICDLQVSGTENSTHPVTSLTLSRFPASPARAMEYFEKVCRVLSTTSIRHGMARCYKGRNRIPLSGFSNGTERTYAWKSLQGFLSLIFTASFLSLYKYHFSPLSLVLFFPAGMDGWNLTRICARSMRHVNGSC